MAPTLVQNGKPLPGVAQVAIQQGRYVGHLLSRELGGRKPPRPFRYFDKGNMAVVGKNFAISGEIQSQLPGCEQKRQAINTASRSPDSRMRGLLLFRLHIDRYLDVGTQTEGRYLCHPEIGGLETPGGGKSRA